MKQTAFSFERIKLYKNEKTSIIVCNNMCNIVSFSYRCINLVFDIVNHYQTFKSTP